jgi:hypothetical protein
MKKYSKSLAIREIKIKITLIDILSHPSQNGCHQENKQQKMLVRTQVEP